MVKYTSRAQVKPPLRLGVEVEVPASLTTGSTSIVKPGVTLLWSIGVYPLFLAEAKPVNVAPSKALARETILRRHK